MLPFVQYGILDNISQMFSVFLEALQPNVTSQTSTGGINTWSLVQEHKCFIFVLTLIITKEF